MAGIYIHIPFCKQACFYCDFHFSTNTAKQQEMVEAIAKELALQKSYLQGQRVQSIYFGGGTPSLLSQPQLNFLLKTVYQNFEIAADVEITLEANPDDLGLPVLEAFREEGINRLSVGIQSFHEPHLQFMNRAHNRAQALQCVQEARKAGFENISIDLIYGIPETLEDGNLRYGHDLWKADIAQAMLLQPQHIAAYCLTIEQDTVFGRWQKQGKLPNIDDEFAAQQFEILLQELGKHGYEQYEISNFCLADHYSRHNSSYWKGVHYLGVGPSAHSFNGVSRQYNLANNAGYLRAIAAGGISFEREILSVKEQINDYLLTTLRTKWGTSIERLQAGWGYDIRKECEQELSKHLASENIFIQNEYIYLSTSGKLLADQITAELMA